MITKKQIGQNIRKWRESLDMSQDDLAVRLGLKRPAVTQIEAGKRDVTSVEASKLAGVFGISVDELLRAEESEEIPAPTKTKRERPVFNREKFEQVLLYVLERCGARANVGETVLYKLLYFADFDFYEKYETFLTGASYRKIQRGPAPCEINQVLEDLQGTKVKKVVTEYYGKPQKKYLPLVEADLSKLSASEKEAIDNVIDRLSSMNAATISEYSHKDIPWELAEDKAIIDYETVFYRAAPYSVRSYPEGP